jgi:hypothetical protein
LKNFISLRHFRQALADMPLPPFSLPFAAAIITPQPPLRRQPPPLTPPLISLFASCRCHFLHAVIR